MDERKKTPTVLECSLLVCSLKYELINKFKKNLRCKWKLFRSSQAMTVIIRDFKQYTVAEKHLQVLLGFVEEDIHDHTKQGTAFPLLKVSSS